MAAQEVWGESHKSVHVHTGSNVEVSKIIHGTGVRNILGRFSLKFARRAETGPSHCGPPCLCPVPLWHSVHLSCPSVALRVSVLSLCGTRFLWYTASTCEMREWLK